jgi:hypothetical protein
MAIVPPPSKTTDRYQDLPEALPVYGWWVRGALLAVVAGLVAVFVTAVRLDPYGEKGAPRRMETHRQLGLPPCTFYDKSGVPCPSCGMTTSFALLVRGDLANSLRANAVGTLLATFCLAVVPWGLASVWCRRPLGVRSVERALMVVVFTLLTLMLLRWGVVLALRYWLGVEA